MCTGKLVLYEKDKTGKNNAQFTFDKYDSKKDKLSGVRTDLVSKKMLKVDLVKEYVEEVKKISKEDSLIIRNHSRKLEAKILVDKYTTVDSIPKPKYDLIIKKILSVDEEEYDDSTEYQNEIKKILLDNKVTDEGQYQEQYDNNDPRGLHWGEGKVYYAPDKSFKIFVFDGEQCGAHCSGWYDSFIQFKSGKIVGDDEDENGIGFSPIISIFKTGTNTYSVIQTSWGGGTIGRIYYCLRQFKMDNDTITYIPFKIANIKTDEDTDEDFNVSSHWSMDVYMEYNKIRNKVQFHYERFDSEMFGENLFVLDKNLGKRVPKQLLPMKNDEILVVKGEFEITDGKIVNYKEWYEKKEKNP